MEMGLLLQILLIFAVAIPTVIVAHRLRFPPVVGLIVTGILIGSSGLRWVQDVRSIEHLAEIGVALLLFSIGLELSFGRLATVKWIALGGGILQILLTIFAAYFVAWTFGWSPIERIFFGCVAALSSTALVMGVLSTQRRIDSLAGRVSAGILILQDLSIAPMLVFLPLVSAQNPVTWVEPILIAIVKIAAVFIALSLLSRFFLNPVMEQVGRTRSSELFLCFVLAFALGVALLTEHYGLSFSFGAFLAGLLLSQTEFRFQALSEVSAFRYVFSSIFFVSIGMLIDLFFLFNHWPTVLGLTLTIFLLKAFITTLSLKAVRLPWSVSSEVGITLAQAGEFSFVILLMGKSSGFLGTEVYNLSLLAVSITLILTPFAVRISPFIAKAFSRFIPEAKTFEKTDTAIPIMGGHVIICGFGPLGQSLGKMLEQHKIPYVVLELNPQTVKKLKGEVPILFGDGASAEILYESGIESARALAVAAPDFLNAVSIIEQAHRLSPDLPIITRARYRSEVDALYKAGAEVVISEELEAGVEMGRYLLLHLDIPNKEVEAFVKEIRDFGSADFF